MIKIEEITLADINDFWKAHIDCLLDDEMISSKEDISYFSGRRYRGLLEEHMVREKDKQHMAYFLRDGIRIGAVSYCTFQSEDGKCFILDFWVFPSYRGGGTGHKFFRAFFEHAKAGGALYYALNCDKESSHRFWLSLGFADNGVDDYGAQLMIKR